MLISRAPAAARVGACAWVLAAALFLTGQLVVAGAWRRPYSWADNTISDLGDVRCGPWGDDGRRVCSPLHPVMNATFVITGLLVLVGAVLLRRCEGLGGPAGRLLLALAATGYVVAGLAPADVHENVHVVLGAVPVLFAGNLALLLPAVGGGRALRGLRTAGALAGTVGSAGVVLFLQHRHLGLGTGGMERVAVLPLQVHLLLVGLVLLRRPPGQDGHRGEPGRRAALGARLD